MTCKKSVFRARFPAQTRQRPSYIPIEPSATQKSGEPGGQEEMRESPPGGAGLGPYTHPWAAPKNPRAHISMFIRNINMSRAFGPIIVLISTCLQVRSRPYCMDMHLASTKGGYINFYRTCGPHFWRSMNCLDPSDSCYAKNEVRTCGRT